MCLDVGPVFTCGEAPLKNYDYCNPSLSVDTRVKDLISRMTVPELLSQMAAAPVAIPR